MPSRKKAKGQARKAAKVKKKEELLAEKNEEFIRGFEHSQIQRLQINNQSSVQCLHGFVPFPNDDVCIKFVHAFVHEFYIWFRKIYTPGKNAERIGIGSLLGARESTQDEYSVVWNDAAKMKQVISYFLYNGTMLILDYGDNDNAITSALFARFFEQWIKVKVHKSKAFIDWSKVMECGVGQSDAHTFVKFFWRRIRCSCLDKKYEEVKSTTKMGICFNSQCTHHNFVERDKLRCCSRCRIVNYCSRECQVADWSDHKELCDEVAAARANFDASQKQQT